MTSDGSDSSVKQKVTDGELLPLSGGFNYTPSDMLGVIIFKEVVCDVTQNKNE